MPRQASPLAIDLTAPIEKQPAYLTIAEAAAYLRCSTRALARWEARGLLRFVRPAAGYPLVPRCEIQRLLGEGGAVNRRSFWRSTVPVILTGIRDLGNLTMMLALWIDRLER